ncbi:hypothetical protein VNO80_02835 [Phaseolus coccineus]|uniref:TF-B3 domain-containing protein n=1 Tax=Phaseolus coccineus TaxID=3886 RepID=A0AAN9NS41_PHACN
MVPIVEEILTLDTRGLFYSMNIRGENVYVDRAFAIKFQGELAREWTLADSVGNVHTVYYNQDIVSPKIMDGGSTLSAFYGFKGDHSILFCYVGQSCFHITVYMGAICQNGVNRHLKEVQGREPLMKGPFEHFHLKLSSFNINGNYLDLPAEFAEYLRKTRFLRVTLHGLLHEVQCRILRGRFPTRNIKLGKGWKKFCSLHFFREDDEIIFECQMMSPSSIIRVLSVMTNHYKRQNKVYD